MCDHNGRAVANQICDGPLDQPFGFRIQRRSRFVQNQDGRIEQDGARNREALSLSTGKKSATLADHGIITVGQFHDEIVRKSDAGGSLNLFVAGIGTAVGDVVPHRVIEEHSLLSYQGDLTAQTGDAGIPQIDAVP